MPVFAAALLAMRCCKREAILGLAVCFPVVTAGVSLISAVGFPADVAESKDAMPEPCAAGSDPMGPANRMAITPETISILRWTRCLHALSPPVGDEIISGRGFLPTQRI